MTFEQRVALRKQDLEAEDRARRSMPPPSPEQKALERIERAKISRELAEWHVQMERRLEEKR